MKHRGDSSLPLPIHSLKMFFALLQDGLLRCSSGVHLLKFPFSGFNTTLAQMMEITW